MRTGWLGHPVGKGMSFIKIGVFMKFHEGQLWNKKIIWECRKRVWGWRKNLLKIVSKIY